DSSSRTAGVAHVVADGNVIVTADSGSEIDLIAGSVAVAGTVAVGASAAVTVVDKTTEAYLGRNADVTGKGNTSTVANLGAFAAASYAPDTGSSDFSGLDSEGHYSGDIDLSPPDASGVEDPSDESSNDTPSSPSLTGNRSIEAAQGSVRGVAVTATNKDNIETIGASGGGGTVGVNVSGVVNTITANTNAFVGENAQVNQDTTGTIDAGQNVLVSAANDYHHMAIVATASGGMVGVALNADVTVSHTNTSAYIDDGANVRAAGDVKVDATGHEDVMSFAFSIAGGFVGVSAPVSVMDVNATTQAYIGQNAASDAAGTEVLAGGSVLVAADNTTDTFAIVGSVAAGAVGVGGAVTVVTVSKDTDAYVGEHASIDAKGGTLLSGVSNGTLDSNGNFGQGSLRGLAVTADSAEHMFVLGASGSFGFYAGVAGGVAVDVIDSDTSATIRDSADINQAVDNAATAHADQAVNVSATNDVDAFAFAGGVGVGIAGIGGGVNVGIIRNDVNASIGTHTEVAARGNVDVNALANKEIETIAISGAGGVAAIAGSVSVWNIGAEFSSDYSVEQRDEDGNKTGDETDSALKSDTEVPVHTFAPGSTLSGSTFNITGHGYDTGDRVVYRSTDGADIGGLRDGQTYVV
ncbi:MAG TPA: hypothetical protein VFH49_08970, partial [Aquabacterium sp.]|nr:hypothetical protein [Aquabacterium sp.]